RTPLTSILGFAQLMRSGKLTAVVRGLDVIERNARAQLRLIEDLLDVSAIIAGKLQIERHPVELLGVIEAAVESLRPTAVAKGIHLSCSSAEGSPRVLGDSNRLQQVFWNLLSNAIKFTPGGGSVVVQVEATAGRLQIRVSDTGEGISPDFLPNVFD